MTIVTRAQEPKPEEKIVRERERERDMERDRASAESTDIKDVDDINKY